jgi:hypothetical protein
MSAEMWDERKVLELDNETLLDDCMEMAGMLDKIESLIVAFKATKDERLLDVMLFVIGGEDEDE